MERASRIRDSCNEKFRQSEKKVVEKTASIKNDIQEVFTEYMMLKQCHDDHIRVGEENNQNIERLYQENNELYEKIGRLEAQNVKITENHTEETETHRRNREQ